MKITTFSTQKRQNKQSDIEADLVVVGGGLAGVCAAITAARQGVRVVLVQDRPVLGGNASSEVRLWVLGATSHMGNNNRWAREGGLIDEILVENLYRNKEGNAVIFDTILLEKVQKEANITLLLNTSVYDLEKSDDRHISCIRAFCSQNSTEYLLSAPLFCDASGDGIVGFLAGAAFRIGAEKPEEFGEKFAPNVQDYGELLGHSMYFYSKRAESPVKFIPPAFALPDIREIPRYKVLSKTDMGCRLWWLEYGGRRDTIHDTEEIKWELWKVIYGVWDYIKNSGTFDDVDHLTLEWVATIPGKRESRRFEGLYMLHQRDVIEQRPHPDAVAFGGWAIDLHPADGVYSPKPGCSQWHSKGIYGIPYRCFVSRDIENLWFAGRIISATHVAFGSSRVMATCAHGGQAVGMAAALCTEKRIKPAEVLEKPILQALQQRLNLFGQSIPLVPISPQQNLLSQALITASSTLALRELPADGPWLSLAQGTGQLLPMQANKPVKIKVLVNVKETTLLQVELRKSSKLGNYTPDEMLQTVSLDLQAGEQWITLDFGSTVHEDQYVFVLFMANPQVDIRASETRLTGVLSVFNKVNKAVSNLGKQQPDADIGVDRFEFWTPARRPAGHNLAMQFAEPLALFRPEWTVNGLIRPTTATNAWAADWSDKTPSLLAEWQTEQEIHELFLYFDTDYDHPLESSLMGHPESEIPFCVAAYRLRDAKGQIVAETRDNHQTINHFRFSPPLRTRQLRLELEHPASGAPAALFGWVVR